MRPRQVIAFVLTLMAGAILYSLATEPPADPVEQARLAVRQLDGGPPPGDRVETMLHNGLAALGLIAAALVLNKTQTRTE